MFCPNMYSMESTQWKVLNGKFELKVKLLTFMPFVEAVVMLGQMWPGDGIELMGRDLRVK